LISLSSPAGSASFKYDAMGRRTEKTVNGQTTGFLYDGAQAIAELKGGSIDTVYHTGMAIDEVLARYAPTGNKTLLTDALMSVIAQANDAQGIDNFYAYSAYGEVAVLGPDGGNSLQYTGRENEGTGLYSYRFRYYDPMLKRFVQEDPVGLLGGLNLYSYLNNAPTMYTDPDGLQAYPFPAPPGGINPKSYLCAYDKALGRNNPACQPPQPRRICCDDPQLAACLTTVPTGGMDCVVCALSRNPRSPACISCAQTGTEAAACYAEHCGPSKCPCP